jgi:hypothetical protein
MGKNWKTTLAGCVTAALMALANYKGDNTWQGYLACIGPVVIGVLAKDFNVTGGTVQNDAPAQPPEK